MHEENRHGHAVTAAHTQIASVRPGGDLFLVEPSIKSFRLGLGLPMLDAGAENVVDR